MTTSSVTNTNELLKNTPSLIMKKGKHYNERAMEVSNNLGANDTSQINTKDLRKASDFEKINKYKGKEDKNNNNTNMDEPPTFESPLNRPLDSPFSLPLQEIDKKALQIDLIKCGEEKDKLTKKSRYWVYVLILTINIVTNLENGTIPACTDEIQKDMKISEQDLGLFGSALYTGNLVCKIILILAAIIVMYVINKFNRKWCLIISFVLNGLFVWLFSVWDNLAFLYVVRFLCGIFQEYVVIYAPVWVDQFGPRKYKTILMAIYAVTGPLAIVLGFAMTSLITQHGVSWRLSFIIQGILYGIFGFVLIFIPNVFFSKYQRVNTENNNDIKNNENLNGNENQDCQIEQDESNLKKDIKTNDENNVSVYDEVTLDDSKVREFWKNFCRILRIKVN